MSMNYRGTGSGAKGLHLSSAVVDDRGLLLAHRALHCCSSSCCSSNARGMARVNVERQAGKQAANAAAILSAFVLFLLFLLLCALYAPFGRRRRQRCRRGMHSECDMRVCIIVHWTVLFPASRVRERDDAHKSISHEPNEEGGESGSDSQSRQR